MHCCQHSSPQSIQALWLIHFNPSRQPPLIPFKTGEIRGMHLLMRFPSKFKHKIFMSHAILMLSCDSQDPSQDSRQFAKSCQSPQQSHESIVRTTIFAFALWNQQCPTVHQSSNGFISANHTNYHTYFYFSKYSFVERVVSHNSRKNDTRVVRM